MNLTAQQKQNFRDEVYGYYVQNRRDMPWRRDTRAYYVLLSELMLQQTQVSRVLNKFNQFIEAYPTITELAEAKQQDIMRLWSGLGYNRRARYLHQAAKIIVDSHQGAVPESQDELEALPGIGKNTAAAILAYAYNQPVIYIETNIRSVYAHFFFPGHENITDDEILELVKQTLDHDCPREWYWAVMDYGVFIKQQYKNPSRRTKGYVKQSVFEGSRRQLRGKILMELQQQACTGQELASLLRDQRTHTVLDDLEAEKLIFCDKRDERYSLG